MREVGRSADFFRFVIKYVSLSAEIPLNTLPELTFSWYPPSCMGVGGGGVRRVGSETHKG